MLRNPISPSLALLLVIMLAHVALLCESQPTLPSPANFCPSFAPGINYFKIRGTLRPVLISSSVTGQQGPIIVFWHGSNGDASDVDSFLDANTIKSVLSQGGVIASPYSLLADRVMPWGLDEGSDDSLLMDEIIGCALLRMQIDQNRIYSVGFGMGGLMVSKLSIEKSDYLASVVIYSGGIAPYVSYSFRNPNNQVAALLFYGGSTDVGYINFEASSWRYMTRVQQQWALHPVFVCNHNQGHIAPPDALPAAWVFLQAYTFGVEPNPFANELPDSFPSYCHDSPQIQPVIEATNETICPVGTYLLESSEESYICAHCPAGSFSDVGSTTVSNCTCRAGYTGSHCTACPRNTYKDTNGTEECTKCPANTVSYGGASIYSCMCLAGYVGVDGGPCHACPGGTYKNMTGAHPCYQCPENTQSGKGSTFIKQCTCKPGYFGDPLVGCQGVQYVILGVFIALLILVMIAITLFFVLKRRAKKAQIIKDQAAFGGVFNEQEHSDREDVGMEDVPATPTQPKSS